MTITTHTTKGVREMLKWIKSLWSDEEGATMVEYALMLALIAIVAILVVTALGTKVATTFDDAQTQLPAGGGQVVPTP
jgi:pilus assembly protein Flp/PilA